ncbi:MAG TPA: FtsX-like permease family protein, partial [Gemmatimonadaceae bacterium]|nr:FtsX-like permease family protein [Gemmatimonadaceae bacterium]
GAVALLLAIACVNVTNLLLARGARRRGELAVRAAIGAGRARLVRQLLTESLLLAAAGGALGMAVAELGVRALVALSPPGLPRVGAIRLDGTVLAFGLGLTTLVGLAFGLVPALQLSSWRALHAAMRSGARQTVGGGHRLTRRTLVVAEVALALVLLVGAGLLLRSMQRLFAVAPGFDPSGLLTMQVQVAGHQFDDDGAVHRFFDQALDAVRRVPGVRAAAFTSQLPLSGDLDEYGVHFESSTSVSAEADNGALRYAVSPGYFEVMGIPLLRGRLLDDRDAAGTPAAVLLSESLARRKFPGADPIGRRLRVGPNDGPWATVVGVVGDVKQASLAASRPDAVYVTTAQWRFADRARSLVVRARGEAAALTPAVKGAVWSVDRDQPIVRVATMDALLAASAAERRFALILFEAFAAAALALAAIGLYGILSGSVAERMRELGVRAALGASRGALLGLVMRQGTALAAAGVAIGLAAAAAASQALAALLFGVSRLDPATYLGVVALLAVVSVVACWVPAWRAARVDPAITLRAE